jgi:hypothetical protein
MKTFFSAVGVLILILALGWIFAGNDFAMYKVFAPAREAVRRDTFEQSKAYNQGVVQELQNMQFEYEKATPAQQAALRSIILHRAADYPEDKLPVDLREFIEGLK